ncbi:MAG: ADP-forming succinate--CoA ligase subunit beta [Sedimenticola sp.]|uniref:Succinate--CoA ligase [ADP-forming] subunit beta n=1 Tax=Sedimenticola thiotaurini TaxID=1543721 RepID=A0A558DBZ4_9GAMM|nr:ADP-forming succinate--CoA ligase subunit beta [Sedimenticola sp.]MCW8974437.1 ADP-forming succinate--CoA ligase subunit beta [Sedimenticola sp.]TVT58530.1 MAG: ADP-forming succinate--CoA ligase subunit beta [Sedimenticola thiotaurini]
MNLHEYQSKQLFAKQGIPVPEGSPVTSVKEARRAAEALGGGRWVVKAQVHAGGRGKVGGVVLVDSLDKVEAEANRLLGSMLVTKQTGEPGLPINTLLIETITDIDRELYLSVLVDRESKKVLFMASQAGGMNIEEVAEETPEQLHIIRVDPAAGLQAYQCRKLAFALALEGTQIREFQKFMFALYNLFIESDASLVEINPLVVTKAGNLIALDAKINLDSNALYRQPNLLAMRDISQEDEREAKAAEHDLNYITLDGNIGCMVNGAGLAMATMDLVQLKGGSPANFLDVGGGTTAERVAEAFKLILSDEKVEAVLVNIFGGIVRCDLIAEGIIEAVKEVDIKVPVVVRLEGTKAAEGLDLLANSGLAITTAADLSEGAEKVVAAAKG